MKLNTAGKKLTPQDYVDAIDHLLENGQKFTDEPLDGLFAELHQYRKELVEWMESQEKP